MSTLTYRVCPHLGLDEKSATVHPLPNSEHRCYAQGSPVTPDLVHQSSCCLTASFARCPLYSAHLQPVLEADAGTVAAQKPKGGKSWLPWRR